MLRFLKANNEELILFCAAGENFYLFRRPWVKNPIFSKKYKKIGKIPEPDQIPNLV